MIYSIIDNDIIDSGYTTNVIAKFTDEQDARAFREYKIQKLRLHDFNEWQREYIRQNPVNKYGGKMLPGDIPSADEQAAFDEITKAIEHRIQIKEYDEDI